MKITELRLNKLFSATTNTSLATSDQSTNTDAMTKVEGDFNLKTTLFPSSQTQVFQSL